MKITTLTLFVFFALCSYQSLSQEEHDSNKIIEFFTLHTNKKALAKDSSRYPAKIILAPIISYKPETSVGVGIGAKMLFKMKGSGDETRTSNMPISFQYTLKNQFILYSGFEIFTPQEKWMLTGNIGLQNFPGIFYGIGRNTPSSNEEKYEFNQILIEPILLKQTGMRYLFLGGGARLNRISSVEIEKEDGLLANTNVLGALGSTSVGLELAIVYDSRDNLLNTKKGWYLELTQGFYDDAFGSTSNFKLTRLDLRYFWKPWEGRQDVIGVQLKSHFASKSTPLPELAYFGSEEIMRGYFEGRYIEHNMIVSQIEYRAKLYKRLGGVVFFGLGDVIDELSNFKVSNLRISYGAGLRFMLDKREDLNIRFDWGFGKNTNNYYLNVAEAF